MNNYFIQPMLGFEQLYTSNQAVNFYTKMFSHLDLSSINEFPRKSSKLTKGEGRKTISRHCIYRAFAVMKIQRLREVSQLLDYLENNIAIAMLCGFPGGRIPGKDVFYEFLRHTPKSELYGVMASNVQVMAELELVDCKNLIEDSMPIFANTKLNNAKSFAKNKFNKDRPPAADSDCKLGVYAASNDSCGKNSEWYWGYKDHLLLDAKYGLPIFNVTLPANTHDSKAGEKLILEASSNLPLKGKVKNLICDKAFDSNPFYEFVMDNLGARVIAPLRSNAKIQLYDGSPPLCDAGLKMHKCGSINRVSGIRFKFICPFRNSKNKSCPCNHRNFLKPAKNKGCIKYRLVKSANLRNCTDRASASFKLLYSKRTAIERYNSRFKFLDNEKASVRNINSVSSIVSISHVCLQLTAIVAAKDSNLLLVRSLASLKRAA